MGYFQPDNPPTGTERMFPGNSFARDWILVLCVGRSGLGLPWQPLGAPFGLRQRNSTQVRSRLLFSAPLGRRPNVSPGIRLPARLDTSCLRNLRACFVLGSGCFYLLLLAVVLARSYGITRPLYHARPGVIRGGLRSLNAHHRRWAGLASPHSE
jgi:hypothetical protein